MTEGKSKVKNWHLPPPPPPPLLFPSVCFATKNTNCSGGAEQKQSIIDQRIECVEYSLTSITMSAGRGVTSYKFSSMASAVSSTGDTIPLELPLIHPGIHILLHPTSRCLLLSSSDRRETSSLSSNPCTKVHLFSHLSVLIAFYCIFRIWSL